MFKFSYGHTGFGGRIASGSSLGAYVRKITALEKVDKEDPRDAVLKYAKVSIVTYRYACCPMDLPTGG